MIDGLSSLLENVRAKDAEIERLRNERLAFATESEERRVKIERLRALLLTVACPGGGWTGQPKEIEQATVADCLAAGVCGCVYGVGLSND